jgi:hypothetical protein
MQFFLYEIVARVVAIYLCVDCCRRIKSGFVEGKIEYTSNGDLLDWLMIFDRSRWVAYRDTTPVRYWIQIGFQMIALVACLGVAILGWWHPNT